MRWIAACSLAFLLAWPLAATAAVPPFELVQKSITQARSKTKRVQLDLRVTETGAGLAEWSLRGSFKVDNPAGNPPHQLDRSARLALRFLWIATLAGDPVAELTRAYGFLNANRATVGVQQDFVYVYGQNPKVSVYRDLKRLAAFMVSDGADRWITRLSWDDDQLMGVMITRNGQNVLTARSNIARPRPTPDSPR